MWKAIGGAMIAVWIGLAVLAWLQYQDRLTQERRQEWADEAFDKLN